MSALKAKVVSITPAIAARLLERNTGNYRKKEVRRVNLYSLEMARGNWELTGDTIKISAGGIILDGQHRLSAIVKSKCTIDMLVVEGVKASAMYIDRGKPRSVRDTLSNLGIVNAGKMSSLARNIIFAQKGLWTRASIMVDDVTDTEIVEFILDKEVQIRDTLALCSIIQDYLPMSVIGPILYYGCDGEVTDSAFAAWFVSAIASGSGLDESEPVYRLRNVLIKNRMNKQHKKDKYVLKMIATKAWNMTLKDEPCGRLIFSLTGPKKSNPIDILKISEVEND